MDFLGNIDAVTKAGVGILTLLGLVFGYLWKVRPGVKQVASDVRAGRDALVGRPAVYDSITGRELAPALKGIGVRMDTNEQQLGELTVAFAKLADSTLRLDEHDQRLKRLEEGVVERVVTKAESAAAWRAVEAVANGTTPDDTPLPGLGEN
jgi:hypothetical protein